MSIDATKLVTTISGLLSREVINEQQKNPKASVPEKNDSTTCTDLRLSQHVMAQLQCSENDIDIEKIKTIKQAISNGSLVINPSKIADALIQQTIEDIKS
ncbi:flagellar biosynthesis anti-sigma factor FlgM [Gilliamella sp. B3791]|uniref:flagellar biosynthesis anti-sigma factor FlgM n=1 Tax=unclassified Gilliamella TaxID=2685620 RepID=UPI002269C90A|nr:MULTISPECIES: flagellar biosynthesis anti-sigma factor FlgM [unclassified Gilliamella]MCX8642648.1 flagellar biosynthesis anti-sigma factor FlgM [Gilliamella sp. B3835]MCX8708122.1 flagellar biosynthesis anti-sigma factor FlgM [Gilliamella sp. B3783]MCX8709674.1 flagellar biosynthesis anti-sigma factor FlgM [Gilliamella sp. B3780]MCX8712989.1 flagellar biosynthesis anti-sigma factor FlgM [Gilliamella sp. B3468]MCX8717317.1 flagellar biosynthesis anti-sigma factor FlgM [Gilliamella sp. B3784